MSTKLRYGLGNLDWQQRVDWQDLRVKRVQRAHQFLNKHGIGAAIVFNWDRRRYLSSCWNHPYSRALPYNFCLLIRDQGFPFVPVERDLDQARVMEDCPWLEGKLLNEYQLLQPRMYRYSPQDKALQDYALCASQVKKLLTEYDVDHLPVSIDYCCPYLIHALEAEGLKVIDGNSWIDECCMVKFDEEIVLMKMAASINEAGYGELLKNYKIGMKEYQIMGIMAKGIYDAGAELIEGWVINGGDRTNPRSFNWSDRPTRPGEFLTVEACHVNWCGYKVCYDRAFIVASKPTELQKEVYDTAVGMHKHFMQLLKPGVTTNELAEKRPRPGENFKTPEQIRAWRATWKNHFGGMGISWDSAPYHYTPKDPNFVLEKNMTMAYHAQFYSSTDAGGVAIENTYVITGDGCELLTRFPYEECMILGL